MMTIILGIAAVVLIVAGIATWHYFLGVPNPPLPVTQVTVVSSSAVSSPVSGNPTSPPIATSTSTSTSPTAIASTPAADSTSTDIANPTLPEERLSIDRGMWTVELATTAVEQARGLSYRTSLAPDAGMLFVFGTPGTQNFWMKDMHFPLDIIWIAENGTVAGFAQDVPAPEPGTALWNLPVYTSPPGVNEVLEVNAGTVAKFGISVGDRVTLSPS